MGFPAIKVLSTSVEPVVWLVFREHRHSLTDEVGRLIWITQKVGLGKSGVRPWIQMVKKKKETRYGKQRDFIRLAVKDDGGFVGELSSEAFSTFGDYGEIIPQWLVNSDVITIIYVKNRHPLGFAMLSALSGEILAIAVIPKYQGSGIGSALLSHIEELASKLGLGRLLLHTAKENDVAHSFFQKAGFRVLGSQEKYYPKGQTALIMSKGIFNNII